MVYFKANPSTEIRAVKLISESRDFYDLNEIIKDIEKFLMSDQSDESWKALGNGLPNPKELFGRP